MLYDEAELENKLRDGFAEVINKNNAERISNIPDFIMADYLVRCLRAIGFATKMRDDWYFVSLTPEGSCFYDKKNPGKIERAVVNNAQQQLIETTQVKKG